MNILGEQFVNSLAVKRGLEALGIPRDRIRVVYNGVEILTYDQAEAVNLREEFDWNRDVVLIGFIGQININKGVMDFIRSARTVVSHEPGCRFLIIGRTAGQNSDFQEKLEQMIDALSLKRYIAFAGWRKEMQNIYKALDIVVIPSRHEEPATNVSIEAMASGVPVVATRTGGLPEMVEDGVAGFLVEKQNVGGLTSRILTLAKDRVLRKKMGEAGRERVGKMFDIRKNAYFVERVLLNGSNSSK